MSLGASHQDLLGAQFVRELEVLRRRLEIRARSGASGEDVARRRGGSERAQVLVAGEGVIRRLVSRSVD